MTQQIDYTNMTSCSAATGVPKKVLRLAKSLNAPGFRTNGTIDWTRLEPWLTVNRPEIDAKLAGEVSLEDLRKETLQRDIKLKDLEIQKRKRLYLDPEDVKGFLASMATAQSAVLKKVIRELPPKLAGRSAGEIEALLEQAILEVFNLFKKGVEKWTPKK